MGRRPRVTQDKGAVEERPDIACRRWRGEVGRVGSSVGWHQRDTQSPKVAPVPTQGSCCPQQAKDTPGAL